MEMQKLLSVQGARPCMPYVEPPSRSVHGLLALLAQVALPNDIARAAEALKGM